MGLQQSLRRIDGDIGYLKSMGRIVTPVKIENLLDPSKKIETDALVDIGAYMMTLPNAWRGRLGDLPTSRKVELHRPQSRRLKAKFAIPFTFKFQASRASRVKCFS